MSRCIGCNKKLQFTDKNADGYAPSENAKYCERCFKLKNYNVDIKLNRDVDNNSILERINKLDSVVYFLCDLINISNEVIDLYNKITLPKRFIVTKCDLIPKVIDFNKIRINLEIVYGIKDIHFTSIKNNYGIEELKRLATHDKSVIFAGITSSGKSSLINKLFFKEVIVSKYENTTLDFISIKDDSVDIVDTPGFYLYSLIIYDKISVKTVKVKKGYELVIEDFILKANNDVNITLFLPNKIMFKTRKNKMRYNDISLEEKFDITYKNRFIIYIKDKCDIEINNDSYSIRKSIIGGL